MTIAVEDRIGLPAIAKLFGVYESMMKMAKPHLEQFPVAEKVGKKKFYSLVAVNAWAKDKDVKELIREGVRKQRYGETADASGRAHLLSLSRRFHAGEFAPKDQKKSIAFRRMSAKVRNTQTTSVQVRPDWY